MTRTKLPSSNKDLLETPFVEVSITMDELKKAYFNHNKSFSSGANLTFGEVCTLLTRLFNGGSVVAGNATSLAKIIALIKQDKREEAFRLWGDTAEEWTLRFPWLQPFGDSAMWNDIYAIHGDNQGNNLRNAMKSTADIVFSADWLDQQGGMSRLTAKLRRVGNIARLDAISQDIWLSAIDQGFRVHTESRWIEDLSESPIGELRNSLPVNFTAGYTGIFFRATSPDMTLVGNMVYSMALNHVNNMLSDLNRFARAGDGEDTFYSRIRSNIPLGAFLGNPVLSQDAVPVVGLHSNPGKLYNILRDKMPGGRNLRQQGVFAKPSQEAHRTGTAANLALVGKDGTTSRRKRAQGFRLLDRDTAETLKGALDVGGQVFTAHAVFEEYLEWYKNKRGLAARISLSNGTKEEWGKWGFNPWRFSEYPENARLFIKILEGA
jgi:hypothetical protein